MARNPILNCTNRPTTLASDRFIPCRSGTDFNKAHHALVSPLNQDCPCPHRVPVVPPSEKDTLYKDALRHTFGVSTSQTRMFTFRSPKYKQRNSVTTRRHDPLDTNTLDWSARNVVVVALGNRLAMWNPTTGEANILRVDISSSCTALTSVASDPSGGNLIVGSSRGDMVMIDFDRAVPKWSLARADGSRIVVVTWCGHTQFFSGTSEGVVSMHDHRSPTQSLAKLRHHPCHRHRITSLQPSPDNSLLACGAENGNVLVWDIRQRKVFETLDAHTSGTKALAWVPWRRRVLVTGGCAEDGHLKLWNVNNTRLLFAHDTGCQITSAVWSSEHMALLTGHGVDIAEGNDILIWKWRDLDPQLEYVSSMTGHKKRPLHLRISPDETTLASAGADETLRVWTLSSAKRREASRSRLDMVGVMR